MTWTKEEALNNIRGDSMNNPALISAELIDCVYMNGIKESYYKDLKGVVRNLIDIAVVARGYLEKYDLRYARSVIEEAIDWEEDFIGEETIGEENSIS